MNAADLLNGIIEATVVVTLTLLLVLPVRKPLRSAFGAGVAYKAWIVVPIVVIAVMFPARTVVIASSPGFHHSDRPRRPQTWRTSSPRVRPCFPQRCMRPDRAARRWTDSG